MLAAVRHTFANNGDANACASHIGPVVFVLRGMGDVIILGLPVKQTLSAHCASHVRTIPAALGQYISKSPLHKDLLFIENKRSSHRLPTATVKTRYLSNATSDPSPVCRVRTVFAHRTFHDPRMLNCDSEHAKCGGVCQTSTPISTF